MSDNGKSQSNVCMPLNDMMQLQDEIKNMGPNEARNSENLLKKVQLVITKEEMQELEKESKFYSVNKDNFDTMLDSQYSKSERAYKLLERAQVNLTPEEYEQLNKDSQEYSKEIELPLDGEKAKIPTPKAKEAEKILDKAKPQEEQMLSFEEFLQYEAEAQYYFWNSNTDDISMATSDKYIKSQKADNIVKKAQVMLTAKDFTKLIEMIRNHDEYRVDNSARNTTAINPRKIFSDLGLAPSLEDIGEETLEAFKENPEKASKAVDSVEKGIEAQKDSKILGAVID
jgi:hypothetical protein